MIQNRIGEEDQLSNPFFRSGQKENLGNNFEIAEEMIQEMIEAMENYNKRGSNWIFKRVIRLDGKFCSLETARWICMDSFAREISAEKSNHKYEKQRRFLLQMVRNQSSKHGRKSPGKNH